MGGGAGKKISAFFEHPCSQAEKTAVLMVGRQFFIGESLLLTAPLRWDSLPGIPLSSWLPTCP